MKVKYFGIVCIFELLMLNSCSSIAAGSAFPSINIAAYTSNPSLLVNIESISKHCNDKYSELQRLKERRQRQINITGSIFATLTAGLSTTSAIYSIWENGNADSRITAVLAIGAGATTVPSFFYFGSDRDVETYTKRIEEISATRTVIISELRTLTDLGAKLQILKIDSAERQRAVDLALNDVDKGKAKSELASKRAELNDTRFKIWLLENAIDQRVIGWSSSCY